MRLLAFNNDGELSLTQFFDNIPPYAILSHTWGLETEEVSFKDIIDGTGKRKSGYEKIRFCGEQARRDGLQYFWVDTCCIDKSNSIELQSSINSMFRWYRDSAKCYVFLADVPTANVDTTEQRPQLPWESAFRRSKWFERGWTLQELIALRSVEFFSTDLELLGDKKLLERYICEITRIPSKALRGGLLTEFSITERMSWAETRKTTYEEDIIYSLLGIFDVYMSLIYGEGKDNARGRLRDAIDRKRKGIKCEEFSIPFSISTVSETQIFVARESELRNIHEALSGDGTRRTAILHGLGGLADTRTRTRPPFLATRESPEEKRLRDAWDVEVTEIMGSMATPPHNRHRCGSSSGRTFPIEPGKRGERWRSRAMTNMMSPTALLNRAFNPPPHVSPGVAKISWIANERIAASGTMAKKFRTDENCRRAPSHRPSDNGQKGPDSRKPHF